MTQNPAGRRRPSLSIIIGSTLILILAVFTVVGAVTVFQLPDPITENAKDVDLLYEFVLAISFIIFFLVTAGIIWAIFRYKRVDDSIPEQVHGSSALEATWTIIPVLILVGLFIPTLIILLNIKNQPAADEIDLRVEAVGHQWWWQFNYPDDGLTIQATPPNYEDLQPPTLVVPVGKTIQIEIRSTDVVHSFGIPQTLYKMHAVPGNVNYMHVKVEDVGVYRGQCYQFCGLRHSDMLFILDARSEADYEAWLRETQAAQGVVPASDSAAREGD
jgi:cytochrome c oxidase subunit 2